LLKAARGVRAARTGRFLETEDTYSDADLRSVRGHRVSVFAVAFFWSRLDPAHAVAGSLPQLYEASPCAHLAGEPGTKS